MEFYQNSKGNEFFNVFIDEMRQSDCDLHNNENFVEMI